VSRTLDTLITATLDAVRKSGMLWEGTRQATVSAVASDGTITVTRGGDTYPRVRRTDAYLRATVGDLVLIHRTLGGWVCLGRPLTADTPPWDTPRTIVKTAATTRTSTTLADDPDLTTPLAALAVYRVEMHLNYGAAYATGTSTGGFFQTAWTVPAGATGVRGAVGPGSGTFDTNANNIVMRSGVHNFGTAVTYGARQTNTNLCRAVETAILTTTTAGTLALQWAQGTSYATGSILGAGSCLIVTRIA
jgi:hypothetical protein